MEPRFPVAEIFGPTIQGEGPLQGTPCNFIRFGGCDYRCEWCDTPHAVLPHMVRGNHRLSTADILERLKTLATGPEWIVISGGNPLLHDLSGLSRELRGLGWRIAVETQGTKWKSWVWNCDSISLSPKPPSSGMEFKHEEFGNFIDCLSPIRAFLKIVVFDYADYQFARNLHQDYPDYSMFLSAGNDAGMTVGNPARKDKRTYEQVTRDLIHRGRWLANQVMVDPDMSDVQVQMQQHVLYWGNERGR